MRLATAIFILLVPMGCIDRTHLTYDVPGSEADMTEVVEDGGVGGDTECEPVVVRETVVKREVVTKTETEFVGIGIGYTELPARLLSTKDYDPSRFFGVTAAFDSEDLILPNEAEVLTGCAGNHTALLTVLHCDGSVGDYTYKGAGLTAHCTGPNDTTSLNKYVAQEKGVSVKDVCAVKWGVGNGANKGQFAGGETTVVIELTE